MTDDRLIQQQKNTKSGASGLTTMVLSDFQNHRKRSLDLKPLTVIAGDTDAGKSAIVRAIKWCLLNSIKARNFIRRGTSGCKVSVKVDGKWIRREKSDKRNGYTFRKEEFDAVRKSVPEVISDHTKVTDINFQEQHDPSFWLSLSPGQLARELNALLNVEVFDRVRDRLTKERRGFNLAKVNAKMKLDKYEEQIKVIRRAAKAAKLLEQHDFLIDYVETLTDHKKDITDKIARLKKLRRWHVLIETMLPVVENLRWLNDYSSDLESHKREAERLCAQLRELEDLWRVQKADYARVGKKLKAIGTCPTCRQPLPRLQ
jgi:exonuclease SbcC